ncbi:MAG TPA: hypothetical protein VNM45_16085 [Bacillus sp. (in: firmicutes)]|nr:hypothetical protein [Bacillus sp. (in: firmicutes)]
MLDRLKSFLENGNIVFNINIGSGDINVEQTDTSQDNDTKQANKQTNVHTSVGASFIRDEHSELYTVQLTGNAKFYKKR